MLEYDPEVIREKARDLIRQGVEIQIVGTINHIAGGLILGLIAGLLVALLPVSSAWREILSPGFVVLASTLVLGGIGYLRGVEEARDLRFRAHVALCQLEIERHLSELVSRGQGSAG